MCWPFFHLGTLIPAPLIRLAKYGALQIVICIVLYSDRFSRIGSHTGARKSSYMQSVAFTDRPCPLCLLRIVREITLIIYWCCVILWHVVHGFSLSDIAHFCTSCIISCTPLLRPDTYSETCHLSSAYTLISMSFCFIHILHLIGLKSYYSIACSLRRQYQALSEPQPRSSSASPSLTVWACLSTLGPSSARAHRQCMPSKSCTRTAWTMSHCKLSIGRSSSPKYTVGLCLQRPVGVTTIYLVISLRVTKLQSVNLRIKRIMLCYHCTVRALGLTSHSIVYLYIAVCCRLCRRVCSVCFCSVKCRVPHDHDDRRGSLLVCLWQSADKTVILLSEHSQWLSLLAQHSQVVGTAHIALSLELL